MWLPNEGKKNNNYYTAACRRIEETGSNIDDEEEWVKWVAEKDEKTCSVCHGRDGKIYEINSVPCDPHPNCRCRRERVSLWEKQKKQSSPRK
jgi:hypothetical protein